MTLSLPDVGVTLAAVALGEGSDDVPELDRLSPRALPAKRASFVAGRRAARRALERRWGELPAKLRIDADDAGRPLVWVDGERSPTCVSISHAGGIAIAAASDAPLGIDLIELEDLPSAMDEDVFAPGELTGFVSALSVPMDARCLAFAAKECALKWLGIGMAVPLRSVRVDLHDRLAGELPWRASASLVHREGRAALTLFAWPVRPALWAVLLTA